MAAWLGIAMLLALRTDKGPYAWCVLFGTLVALSMYPRVDALHAIVASPPALVVGAGGVAYLSARLKSDGRWQRVGVLACLLSVPAVAVAPQLVWRAATIVSPAGSAPRLDYAELGLARAPVVVPRRVAEDVRGVVAYVQAGTPQGQPLFVYPVAPLLNFLADRPNPTRFDHYLPGTLTPDDLARAVSELDNARPRYVVWDHLGVVRWDAVDANGMLTAYIWRCYHEVAAFSLYLVLERIPDAC
jgi:hypothetical protein